MASAAPWAVSTQTQVMVDTIVPGGFGNDHKRQDSDKPPESTLNSSEDGEIVYELARGFIQHSIKNANGEHVNPFDGPDDSMLDPQSEKFNYKTWIKNLVGIQSRDPDRYPARVAGISYKNLGAHGFGEATDYQKTFGNYPLEGIELINRMVGRRRQRKIQILKNFDGLIQSREMLVVLGRPGSGCSTLLKTISGETDGFFVDAKSQINYQGIPMETMHKDFRGECIYQAEVDVHFPQLTVGQTLEFAARARAPQNRIPGVTRDAYAKHMRDVIMAVFGLTHTLNTKVGNDFIRGVSGGERKRVSIAEAALGGSPLQCWDNSTRGLDSATALEFVKTLRLSTEMTGRSALRRTTDLFRKYPARQTTADFLTSLTSPAERAIRPGFEGKTPYTPDEFVSAWQNSDDRAQLLKEIDAFEREYPVGGDHLEKFKESRRAAQAGSQRVKSPYTLSVPMQIMLCVDRGFQRLRGDMSLFLSGILGQAGMALVIGSVFYNLENNTGALFSRGALLFMAILMAAFQSALEILTLYAQRPIVEKQSKYAFYHPFAEAVGKYLNNLYSIQLLTYVIASMACELPNKIGTTILFDLGLYFMTNLRRTPENFFVFFLFTFMCTLTMSMYFRSIAAFSRTLSQAMAPAAIFVLALVIYTGFAIPIRDMHPWFRWINYIDPVAYAFGALMINEFHDRQIPCTAYVPSQQVPGYENVAPDQRVCSTTGSAAGADFLDGDTYINVTYKYHHSHLWRNFGVIIAFMIFGCAIYLTATEYISAKKSKGEVLLFRRGRVPDLDPQPDEESNVEDRVNTETVLARQKTLPDAPASIQKQTAIFHWDEVNYDIKIKGEPRRLLDGIDGWVCPGTLTALMGVSGAGKTTLLDVLASRVTMGVVSGQMLVDGRERDSGFQRKTG
ncbi:hypothetical protein V502_05793 [Pseudogymnoascus sp. VKM F-4520 (FW-2644)]|nr:hypothetical protein V502_05793 [Pseudogymnoascus sp. VKM F-4520 (FW-2644)]